MKKQSNPTVKTKKKTISTVGSKLLGTMLLGFQVNGVMP